MKNKTDVRALTECAIMVAFATVLSLIKLTELPYGGSITLASMLPVVVVSYRHGMKWGVGTALVTSLLQMLLGLNNFSYFTSWYSIVALAIFDYILAFTAYGLSGIFRKIVKKQNISLLLGAFSAALVRYVCHVISGATIWAGLSIPDSAALIYSIGYNATYMIPDTLILCLVSVYVGSVIDFRARTPVRVRADSISKLDLALAASSGGVLLGALIFDTVTVFKELQDGDGNFIVEGLSSVNWSAVGIVSGICILISIALFITLIMRSKIPLTK